MPTSADRRGAEGEEEQTPQLLWVQEGVPLDGLLREQHGSERKNLNPAWRTLSRLASTCPRPNVGPNADRKS